MSPKSVLLSAVFAALVPTPVVAVTVAVPPPIVASGTPTASPGPSFTDPAPDIVAFHPPLAHRRVRLDHAPRGDDDIDSFAFDGTLAVVPEPRVWALLLTGYGMIGFALRRRGWARHVSG